jgi:hypothetical protein
MIKCHNNTKAIKVPKCLKVLNTHTSPRGGVKNIIFAH